MISPAGQSGHGGHAPDAGNKGIAHNAQKEVQASGASVTSSAMAWVQTSANEGEAGGSLSSVRAFDDEDEEEREDKGDGNLGSKDRGKCFKCSCE